MTSATSKSTMTALLLSTLLLINMPSLTDATKHTFKAVRDHRTFIGPLGAPFGFLEKGTYKLSVSNFNIGVKDHHRTARKQGKSGEESSDDSDYYLQKIHPGFLLKRFENENEFANFQETIYDNVTSCGFGDFIHGGLYALDDDNNINTQDAPNSSGDDYYENLDNYEDRFIAKGPGVIDGGKDGIFLSMKNKDNMWHPKTPTLEHQFTVGETGFYFMFYQICLPQVDNISEMSKFLFKELSSSFLLDFEYTNVDSFGKVSHLTAGEMPLPHIYLYFTVSYIILLVLWVQSMNKKVDGRGPTIYAIHHLMSSVVFLKMVTMLLESLRYHFIRVNGHAEFWSFTYYFTNFVKGTFLFIVILLIGSGWSFFKPHLSQKERRILLFVVVLQIIDNVAVGMLAFETENESLYNDWSTILHLVDIVSCCALLLPIVWQVNSLEESVEVATGSDQDEESDLPREDQSKDVAGVPVEENTASSTRLQSRLYLFRTFYLIVVGYIYFTRIVIYLFASSLKYDQTWIRTFVYELGTLTFYFVVGIKFKPIDESTDYSKVVQDGSDEDEDLAALLPQSEEKEKDKQQIELSKILKKKKGKKKGKKVSKD